MREGDAFANRTVAARRGWMQFLDAVMSSQILRSDLGAKVLPGAHESGRDIVANSAISLFPEGLFHQVLLRYTLPGTHRPPRLHFYPARRQLDQYPRGRAPGHSPAIRPNSSHFFASNAALIWLTRSCTGAQL